MAIVMFTLLMVFPPLMTFPKLTMVTVSVIVIPIGISIAIRVIIITISVIPCTACQHKAKCKDYYPEINLVFIHLKSLPSINLILITKFLRFNVEGNVRTELSEIIGGFFSIAMSPSEALFRSFPRL